MNLHRSARSCPASRGLLVDRVLNQGFTVVDAAAAAGVSVTTAYKWIRRFEAEGVQGLGDRSSRPKSSPTRLDDKRRELVLQLRRQKLSGVQIARQLKIPRSTVARVIKQAKLSRRRDVEPLPPVVRYEWPKAGDMLHVDVKKLARFVRVGHRMTGSRLRQSRGAGWEFVHVCVDDATRLAYVEILGDEKGPTTVGFLQRAVDWFRSMSIEPRRVLSDNGTNYRSKVFRAACLALGVRHLRTQPYTPRTNGKAERFIQTLLREWAYVVPYDNSKRRAAALPRWIDRYNRRRPHGSLGGQAPINRLRSAA